MTTMKLVLDVPSVPNFVFFLYDGPPRKRQDGFKEREGVDIADLTDETLNSLAEEWRLKLLNHAAARRKARDNEQT